MSDPFRNEHSFQRLQQLVGRERALTEISRSLHDVARGINASVVGAMHVTCADESEQECISVFQRAFAQPLLPPLKFAVQSPFRLANLGGRYEWGAIGIAENHYQVAAGKQGLKFLVVKINAHVGVVHSGEETKYGMLERYGHP